jgi:hypothetical protein
VLLYWKSGTKQVPSGPASYFSKTNWDNHVEQAGGRNVLIKKASRLVSLVLKLKETQWAKIIDGAMALAKHRKVENNDADIMVADSSDFEIEDGDKDIKIVDGDDDIE